MAELGLYRGEKSKVKNLPLKDGQVLIGTISDKTAAIYIDTINNAKELIRVEIDLSEYMERIESLELAVELMNRSITDNLTYAVLQTKDNINIVTSKDEIIICDE